MDKITLAEMAYFSFCFRNDLHYLHHHIAGPNFLELHEMLGEYYNKALEDFDYFSEHAIANGEKLMNVNEIYTSKVYKYWDPVKAKDDVVHEDAMTEELERIGIDYIEALDVCRETLEDSKDNVDDIISDLDSIKSYWRIQIKYINEQRGK